MLDRYPVTDSRWLTQCRLTTALDQHAVDHTDDRTGLGFEYRAAAIPRIRGAVELENLETTRAQLQQRSLVELARAWCRQRHGRDRGNDAAMGDMRKPESAAEREAHEGDSRALTGPGSGQPNRGHRRTVE